MSELFAETRGFVQPETLAFLPPSAPKPFTIQAPENWKIHQGTPWVMVRSPRPLSVQGWKIHVSAKPNDAEEILSLVSEFCWEKKFIF
ncbi:hypothetical protein [Dermatophilus congolensis]|uniref:class III lanthionine synthetase LanKC N-terminal domain-containing protein n=1 Tax=Dermatophilus congolensis TaxID=1863 RepID=UPI001AAF207F|nr:hypothetical protein [Dermatophilus congolensis]MBO3130081.1 hypothetical protein [Dermatophilus congolensis]MBO3131292.1 hypothetical protein [Dermatophilus congolensis]MBO3134552.1 hypothetical protein [Dermatophilus congolensis]MBO3136789.1 hypothetical protein [Dermatophilus congolensis]MBO3139033.1 hypothetical protein [Dermatophilus congolensis]